mmetsp:Transcript_76379/g.93805  ORF Transcript_76379/g.93805 Transcript_76379/m.93805 type:complete len:189 (-) Transcript_76379:69-635(-)
MDKMLPEEKSAAPKAERKAPVSLNQLLSPPQDGAQSAPASSSASGSARPPPPGFMPSWGSSQAPMDPAVLAAMMVQAAMMKSSPPAPMMATMPYAGQMPPVCFRPPYGQVPGTYPSKPSLADVAEGSTPASVKVSGLSESLPPMRPPKPSIQAQRISNTIASRQKSAEVPPFVMLLESFCDRMLDGQR